MEGSAGGGRGLGAAWQEKARMPRHFGVLGRRPRAQRAVGGGHDGLGYGRDERVRTWSAEYGLGTGAWCFESVLALVPSGVSPATRPESGDADCIVRVLACVLLLSHIVHGAAAGGEVAAPDRVDGRLHGVEQELSPVARFGRELQPPQQVVEERPSLLLFVTGWRLEL